MPPIVNNPFLVNGRIMRTSFIINTVVLWILALIVGKLASLAWDPVLYFCCLLVLLFLFVIAVFAGIKRLRDVKKSPWLAILLIFPIADVVFQIVLFFLPSEWGEPVQPQVQAQAPANTKK